MLIVLRLGHRLPRDERITTHVCLVARAFGADEIIYSGQKDKGLEKSVKKIVSDWGGNFKIGYTEDPVGLIKEFKEKDFYILHLTMYGFGMEEMKKEKGRNTLIIIGGGKVPSEVYGLADFNISITNQPHSEVAALAITLDRLFKGKELKLEFKGKKRIVPSARGKKLTEF
ncbi:tRNA (cytidine(56)-2'-O)-methyltransferase [Candidatus Micrarchaeota archaeon]|nr:tRNA (cytidine(56)-2'-O)-methyltransferase [Candidatus Micrarchaeota archaeon]